MKNKYKIEKERAVREYCPSAHEANPNMPMMLLLGASTVMHEEHTSIHSRNP